MEETSELFLPVPLIEFLLSRRGGLSLSPPPGTPPPGLERREDIHVEILSALIPLFPIDCPHAYTSERLPVARGRGLIYRPLPLPLAHPLTLGGVLLALF